MLRFTFAFYDDACYYALVNPGNSIVLAVVSRMVETEDHFIFAINLDQPVGAFRSHLEPVNLVGLKTNLEHFGRVACLAAQYEKVCRTFAKNAQPPGQLLTTDSSLWVAVTAKERIHR